MTRTVFQFDGYLLDSNEQRFQKDGEDVLLPPKVFAVLRVLLENHGQLVTNDELMQAVWKETFVEEGNIRYCVHSLRKALGTGYIETIPKRGYRFNADVRSYTADDFIRKYAEGPIDEVPPQPANVKAVWNRYRIAAALIVFLLGVFVFYTQMPSLRPASDVSYASGEISYERITASGRAFFVGLSPDDQHAAYVVNNANGKYSLLLHHLPSGSETEIIAPQEIHISNIQFSPDGNYIYYCGANSEKRLAIYRIPLYGGSAHFVTDELSHYFSVSPDGEWLAFYRRGSDGYELNVCRSKDCSDMRTVATRDKGSGFIVWGSSPSWSPDGAKLIAAAVTKDPSGGRAKRHLVEIDLASGGQKPIPSPDWYGVLQAYWRADGKEIVLLAREDASDPVQIWRLKYPSGEAERITNDANDYREFRPASDLQFLIAATWNRSENLFLVPVANPTSAEQLTFDVAGSNGVWGIKWTPDGKQILHTKADGYQSGNLWRLNLETRESVQFTFDKGFLPLSIDVTANGESAMFSSNRTGKWHIWKVNLDGTDLRQLTDGDGESHSDISPDGKWLYFARDGLWKMPLEGGKAIRVLLETVTNPRVSPMDPTKFLAFYYDPKTKDQQYKLGLFSENEPLKPQDLNIPARAGEWKPDGTGFYYLDTNGESFNNIWFLSLDAPRTPIQITNFTDQKISNLSLSPDGTTLALSRGSAIGNIVRIDLQR